jgi:predicted secreted acid phosphatase
VPFLRNRPRPRRRSVVLLALATVLGLVGGGIALADGQPAIQTSTPRSENQITNLDVLRQQIANYYGDPLKTGVFPQDGNYAKEAKGVAAQGAAYLTAKAFSRTSAKKAIVLDVDDTTLATWNYEVTSNWAYNPDSNADYVLNQRFPAVPGMVAMVNLAKQEGYAIFFLTGRGAAQEPATLGNLTKDGVGEDAGYPMPTTLTDGENGLFTKPARADYPQYLKDACAAELAASATATCTTIHYKSATRAHIESQGYDIVGNFGDQFSDLTGGSADKTFKLPNPNYYLP